MTQNSTFYIVATPIGNLEDITLRALRILKESDYIFCEDTRTTKKLLSRYDIHTPTKSYHSHSGKGKEGEIVDMLKEGKTLALVCDAGTPTISDPGSKLISHIRESLPHIQIVPIPGASALTTALSGAGIKGSQFTFLGFLPHKKGRETLFKEVSETTHPVVFYESPHRILKTLEQLGIHISDVKKVTLARELTKIHEEFLSGTAAKLKDLLLQNPEKTRGEFVVIVSDF